MRRSSHSNRQRRARQQRASERQPDRIPEPYNSIVERVTNQDREYFERHPWATEYQRPMVWGEFWPLMPVNVAYIVVAQIKPGMRIRGVVCNDSGGQAWREAA